MSKLSDGEVVSRREAVGDDADGPLALSTVPSRMRKDEFVRVFLQLAPKELQRLTAPAGPGELQRQAHGLEGSGALLGFPALRRACEELERFEGDDEAELTRLIDRVLEEFELVCRALESRAR